MNLLVGLGNPGARYVRTRHNIGFRVLDELLRRTGGAMREKFKGEVARLLLGGHDAVLLKPMTFMNLSGESVRAAADFFKVAPADVVVIHDELDLPFGRVKVKAGGGHAGHNGLRSIHSHIGSDYIRVRCGIGRPERGDPIGYVLGDFPKQEEPFVADLVDAAADAAEAVILEGVAAAMNRFNGSRADD